jgi:hypothetical protein
MANTFKALAGQADWAAAKRSDPATQPEPAIEPPLTEPAKTDVPTVEPLKAALGSVGLHYNIQIHLPDSRDPAVFEAIFQALKRHLL